MVVTAVASDRPVTAKRQEIEGLRTLAALLVATYHFWFDKVSGGVDVFFVVTGFLITLTLVGHVRREGRIRPAAFLGRIARRVWPMAATVLGCVLVLSFTLAPEALRARNFAEVIASALYVENWYLAFNAVDYLNAEDPHTPVQHYWALSVQGQFYLVWLLLALVAAWLAGRGTGEQRFKQRFGLVIAVVGVASFAWSIHQTAVAQPFAYFSTFTRLWEFAVGGLLALAGTRIVLRGVAAGIASWTAVVGLVACGMILPVAGIFPGWAALWPVSCAALLLAASRAGERPWAATRLLSWRPLAYLGGVAFGIYLWHYPMLIGYRYLFGELAHPGRLAGTAMIVAAIVLAVVGNHVIERPIQRGWAQPRLRPAITIALVGALVTVVAVAAIGRGQSAAAESGLEDDVAQAESSLGDCFGYPALASQEACREQLGTAPLVPRQAALLADIGDAYTCYTKAQAEKLTLCTFGPGPTRVALVGNSHAAMFTPTLQRHADELGWEVTTVVGNGCLWGPDRPGNVGPDHRCAQRLQEAEELLLGGEPFDAVIYNGGRRLGLNQENTARRNRIQQSWRELIEHGSRVVVIEDNPRIGEDGAACVVDAPESELRAGGCDLSQSVALEAPDLFVEAAEGVDGAAVVPTEDLYCSDATCPVVIGSVIVYRDQHHLTATYLKTAEAELLRRLGPLVG